jgi:peptide/nickel transport system substrate-binding protein
MTRWKAALAALCLAMPAFLGIAQAQTLRIGLAEDPDVLDPTLARTFVGRIVFAAMCDKLVDIGPDLKIVPQLATAWHWTDDDKALVMTLRQGVLFQDGEKFDAAAVKYNIERALTLPGSNRRAEISPVTGVDIIDDHTVKITLKAPFAPLLAALSDRAGMMLAPKAAEKEGAKFGLHPVCAGPFKFVERVPEDRIVLQRFKRYWNAKAIKLDRIVYLPIPDSSVRLANLQSGGLDLIERVAATDVARVKKDPHLALSDITQIGYQGLTINVGKGKQAQTPLGQDPRVRQALQLSLDRTVIDQVVFNGEFTPGNQWVPPSSPYYVKSLPIPPRDIAKAKALLAAAKDPHPTFTMMVPNNPEQLQAAQVIQAMAGEAGFTIKLQATEFTTALQLAQNGDFQAFLLEWSGRTDPDGNIYNFVTCKGPLDYSHYCNPTVDSDLDAARAASGVPARLADYTKVADITLKELPIIYLWHQKWIWAMTRKLHGFVPYPDGLIRPQGLTLK